ncbi:alpha/beta hydrolase [Nocardioides bigeumensis]|uniref:Alpha/beta hydrolase n=1 Tax=Nocardioides bigeumensis TaxID=433657 RepID=A0ABP5JDN1_9ACTN
MTVPTLTPAAVAPPDDRVRGVVLMLHGGKDRSTEVVDDRSLSRRRSLVMQRALAPAFAESGLLTCLMSYRVRGWNGGSGPVEDARWALEQVRRELGDLPVVLLGHSMGGRTAVHVADDAAVVGVVGLAPWWPGDEPVEALRGKHLVGVHGSNDRITSYRQSERFVERASTVAATAEHVVLRAAGHYMLRRASTWNAHARDAVLTMI